jgi:hypothetical protein
MCCSLRKGRTATSTQWNKNALQKGKQAMMVDTEKHTMKNHIHMHRLHNPNLMLIYGFYILEMVRTENASSTLAFFNNTSKLVCL